MLDQAAANPVVQASVSKPRPEIKLSGSFSIFADLSRTQQQRRTSWSEGGWFLQQTAVAGVFPLTQPFQLANKSIQKSPPSIENSSERNMKNKNAREFPP
jgi:hypothetical protein